MVDVSVYNSAGERVRGVYSGPCAYPASQIQIAVAGPQAGGAPVLVTVLGLGIRTGDPVWYGNNDTGQWVANGVYYIKATTTDPFGQDMSHTQSVAVTASGSYCRLQIYNSAGELVRSISLNSIKGTPSDLAVALPSGRDSVAVSNDAPASIPLVLTLSGGQTFPMNWDGRGDQGGTVAAGNYYLQLVRNVAGVNALVKTVTVSILKAPSRTAQALAASAKVGPNPWLGQGPLTLAYSPNPSYWASARLYDLGGEIVGQGTDFSGAGLVIFRHKLSAGLYLMVFDVGQGEATLARRIVKVAVSP